MENLKPKNFNLSLFEIRSSDNVYNSKVVSCVSEKDYMRDPESQNNTLQLDKV